MSTTDPLSPPRSSNARTIAIVTIVIAFIAGALVGMVGDRIWMVRHQRRRGPGFVTARVVKRLDRELSLTPQQHDQVTRILQQHQQRVAAITAVMRPQIRREIEQGNAEIEQILTPEQRTRFQQMRMRVRRDPGR